MLKIAMIAAGGAVGATLRYAVSGWVQKSSSTLFPSGTLAVNLIGCFLIGWLGAMFASPHLIREEFRVAILVGVLGAFTTFSTFGWETFQLVNAGQVRLAAINMVLSNSAGLMAVWLGYRLGARWFGA